MRYLGGKAPYGLSRFDLGLEIVKTIYLLTPSNLFIDMCCGALNVSRHVRKDILGIEVDRVAIDICLPLITTLKETQKGWEPPESVSKDYYQWAKQYGNPLDPLTGFCMFGRSYGGAAWNGLEKDWYKNRHVGKWQRNSLKEKQKDIESIRLFCMSLFDFPDPPAGTIIYCDPPYQKTKPYKYTPPFDHSAFWKKASNWHNLGCHVYVSEGKDANPPASWFVLKEWQKESRLTNATRIERLYVHEGIRVR